MISLRLATAEDKELLVSYANKLYSKAELYHCFTFSYKRVLESILEAVQGPRNTWCSIIAVDTKTGQPVGCLIGHCSLPFFSMDPVANEFLFYVEKKKAAPVLLKAYEYWARKAGAKVIGFSTMNTNTRYFERKGFTKSEHSYFRRLD